MIGGRALALLLALGGSASFAQEEAPADLPLQMGEVLPEIAGTSLDTTAEGRAYYARQNISALGALDEAVQALARRRAPDLSGELPTDLLELLGARRTHPARDERGRRLRAALEPLGKAYRALLAIHVTDADLPRMQRTVDLLRPESEAVRAITARDAGDFEDALASWTDLDRLRLGWHERRRLGAQPEILLDTLTVLGAVLRELGEQELAEVRGVLAGELPPWSTPEQVALFEIANDGLMGAPLEAARVDFLLQMGNPEEYVFLRSATRCAVLLHSLLEDEEANRGHWQMRGPWEDPRLLYPALSPVARTWGDTGMDAVLTAREALLERERARVLSMRALLDGALGSGPWRGRRSLLGIPALEDPSCFGRLFLPRLLDQAAVRLETWEDWCAAENAAGRDITRFIAETPAPADPYASREALLESLREIVRRKQEEKARMLLEEQRLLMERERQRIERERPGGGP